MDTTPFFCAEVLSPTDASKNLASEWLKLPLVYFFVILNRCLSQRSDLQELKAVHNLASAPATISDAGSSLNRLPEQAIGSNLVGDAVSESPKWLSE